MIHDIDAGEITLHLPVGDEFDTEFSEALRLRGGKESEANGFRNVTLTMPDMAGLMDRIAYAHSGPQGILLTVDKVVARGHDSVRLGYALNIGGRSSRFVVHPTDSSPASSAVRACLARLLRRTNLAEYMRDHRAALSDGQPSPDRTAERDRAVATSAARDAVVDAAIGLIDGTSSLAEVRAKAAAYRALRDGVEPDAAPASPGMR
jgi:hypothetical protein